MTLPCVVEGCEKPRKSHGFCSAHWNRVVRHGTIEHGRRSIDNPYVRDEQGNIQIAWCDDCRAYKPALEFYVREAGSTPYSYCKDHWNKRQQAKRQERRDELAKQASRRVTDYHAAKRDKAGGEFKTGSYAYPGLSCAILDGREFVKILRAQDVTRGIVRGWEATVPTDADGYVQPRFERPGFADLWTKLFRAWMEHSKGIRV